MLPSLWAAPVQGVHRGWEGSRLWGAPQNSLPQAEKAGAGLPFSRGQPLGWPWVCWVGSVLGPGLALSSRGGSVLEGHPVSSLEALAGTLGKG